MNALVFGCGRSGRAADRLLTGAGHAVTVLDGEAAFPAGTFDVAVVSPGIALTHPWIAEAKRRGIPLKSELQLGCEALGRRGWKLLAVTGSKGKSSVVKIVADAINLAGLCAVPCGNYGLPVCEVALSDECGWAVVEVSSFMMETTELPPGTFEAAAILNLQEDHLDRHGSAAVYHALKRKLLTMAATPLDLSDERFCREQLQHLADGAGRALEGTYFDNEILRANGFAAVSLMAAVRPRIDAGTVERAFREFRPLPHRMNLVLERDGVRHVDDSKATSLAALVAGVKMASGGGLAGPQRSVRLIAGGLPKGDDPAVARAILAERVSKAYLIGRCAETFHAAWKDVVACEVCGTLARAVGRAMAEARPGETVLLSPGTASFDQFKSYGERGDAFARLVTGVENRREI